MTEGEKISSEGPIQTEKGGELAWGSGRVPERDYIQPEQAIKEDQKALRESKHKAKRTGPPNNSSNRKPLGHRVREEFLRSYLGKPELLPQSAFPETGAGTVRSAPLPRSRRSAR